MGAIILYCGISFLSFTFKALVSISSPILSNILCKSDGYVSQLHPNFCLCNIICIHGTPLCGVKSLFSHKNEWKWSLISCMYANARKKSKERSQTAFLHFWRLNWRWLLFTSGDRQEREGKYLLAHTKIHNHHLCDDNTGREHIKILPWCFVRKLPLVPYRTCHLSFVKTDSPVAN